jgi:hypothetical protein
MRFDVVYTEHGPKVEPHFCREWHEDGGCYGTNPSHGVTWDEARAEVVRWHEEQAAAWKDKPLQAILSPDPASTASVPDED